MIPCSAVVFTTRKLSEFKDISENCIFIDASELTIHEFDAEEIQILASKFLNLLYDNADHDLKSQKVQNILDNTLATDTAQKKIIMLCDIYRHIVQGMFDTYGIGNSEEEL